MTNRNLFFIISFLFTVTAVLSQDSQTQAQKLTDNMKANLSLTDEQVKQVLPVNQSFVESMQALRASGGGKMAQYRKFKTADDKRDQSLKAILTREQYSLFEEHKKENREAMKDARKNH